MAKDNKQKSFLERMGESQVWKSIIRSGVPHTRRQRMHAILGSVFLHLHPARLPKHAVKVGYTWCMGGLSFFLFVVLTITGILLMFYYRPTVEYAYTDIIDLTEQVPLGMMRELHRWGAHAMVLTVWLHMLRVFMTGSYKPPREFNWGVGVLLMTMTMFLSFTGYLLPWDQLAIWAVTVGTNMARAHPFIGHEGPVLLCLQLEILIWSIWVQTYALHYWAVDSWVKLHFFGFTCFTVLLYPLL